jgi:hypothetical protein
MNRNFHISQRFVVLGMLLFSLITTVFAQKPADLMRNCKQWKITYPTGKDVKALCTEANNEFFRLNDSGDAIVFRAPIRKDNGTTPNSSYIRSELREMKDDGSTEIYWTTTGRHLIYVKQAITHLPIKKPELVATQIHGSKDAGIDDAMVMRLEKSHLFLSFNGGVLRSDVTIKTDYVLGTVHEVIFLVIDDKHYCYYAEDGLLLNAFKNGTASSYLVKSGGNDYVMIKNYDQSYFKVGNYTQSNPEKEGTATDDTANYGEVVVYDFLVNHEAEGLSVLDLSENSDGISTWPNPVSNRLNISGATDFKSVEIYNLAGKLIVKQSFNGSYVDVSKLNSGQYVFRFLGEGKAVSKSIIKR